MNPNTLHEVSTLLSTVSALLSSAVPAAAAMIPVHQNTSNEVEKTEEPETAAPEAPPAPHEINTLGSQFSSIHAALQWVSHNASNPIKNRWNAEEGYAWNDLPELHRTIKPLLYQAGVFYSQTLKTNEDGKPEIITTFRHIPTDTIHIEHLEIADTGVDKQIKKSGKEKELSSHQKWGYTMTYCRRYALYAALGLQPDDCGDLDDSPKGNKKRNKPAQPDALHDEIMQCLPDVTSPGWREAEAKAIAMGATPYTEEQIAQAWENARTFKKLTPEECQFLNVTFEHLKKDYSSVDPIWQKYKAALDQRARAGDIRIVDQEDLSRGYFRCWLLAAQEFAGVTVSVLCEDDEPEQDIAPDVADVVADDLPAEEQARLKQKRDERLAGIRSGTVTNSYGDTEDDAVCDALYAQVKSGLSPQPPIRREYVDAPEKPLVTVPESDIPY